MVTKNFVCHSLYDDGGKLCSLATLLKVAWRRKRSLVVNLGANSNHN